MVKIWKNIYWYRRYALYRWCFKFLYRAQLPMMGGISLWQTGKFFLRQVKNEPLGMRASAIAFNLFL
ncbi:MAG: hypothetical protein SGJ04_06565, partial [Bacteroidota bacterium]|nr:hypothetical protein [Bacteroidota bacterium]